MEPKNLWILTEERPKIEVICNILDKFAKDNQITCFIDTIRILPILDKNRKFSFLYEVVGFYSKKINKVFIKIVSGYSSFVDFLIFYQNDPPNENDIPLYAIEETKTDDKESRNTGVYQRASKFVYLKYYYPDIRKIMLYNLRIPQKNIPTKTYIFGIKCLLTLGVEIIGKKHDPDIFTPFKSVNELIQFKANMRKAPKRNIPILIQQEKEVIKISGRLYKSGRLSHDPNIGAISLICATLRKLGWEKEIVITSHGLLQDHLTQNNKFVKIANMLNLKLEGLEIPTSMSYKKYWKYETEGEKLATIFIHLVVENYRERYKNGDKTKIINIPDLILIDFIRSEIINIEGKKYNYRKKAIEELKTFEAIEDMYIKKYYPEYKIIRTVILYGGNSTTIVEIEVGFLLNKNGDLVLGIKAPELFKEAIKNLIDFWFN